jgi:tetratricopeptide (TPR) repeat protein
MDQIESVPSALLSILCWELNELRIKRRENFISKELVKNASTPILEEFYRSAFDGLEPAVKRFVEQWLLTPSGVRETVLEETAIEELGKAEIEKTRAKAVLNELRERRVLDVDHHGGRTRFELSHDLLAEAARASREKNELEEMIARMEQEWSSPTASARKLIQEYHQKLTKTNQFDRFGMRAAVALVLVANNLLYVHGYIKEGLDAARKALDTIHGFESEVSDPERKQARIITAALCACGKGFFEAGKFREGKALFRKALNCKNAIGTKPTTSWDDPFFFQILALTGIGECLRQRGYRDQAIRRYVQALNRLDGAITAVTSDASEDGEKLHGRINLYIAMVSLSKALCLESGDTAAKSYQEVETLLDSLDKSATSDAYREYLAAKLRWGQGILSFNPENPAESGGQAESLRTFEDARQRCEGLLKRDPDNWIWRSLQAQIDHWLGKCYLGLAQDTRVKFWDRFAQGRQSKLGPQWKWEEALAEFQGICKKVEGFFTRMQENASKIDQVQPGFQPRYISAVAQWYLCELAEIKIPTSPPQQQVERLEESLAAFHKVGEEAPGYASAERSIILTVGRIGRSLLKTKPNEALARFNMAVEFLRRKPKRIRTTSSFKEIEVWIQSLHGDALVKLSRKDEAAGSFRLSAQCAEEIAKSEPTEARYRAVAYPYKKLRQIYSEHGNQQEGDDALDRALKVRDDIADNIKAIEEKGRIYLESTRELLAEKVLIRSYEALQKAADFLQGAFRLDPVKDVLFEQLVGVNWCCSTLLKELSSDEAHQKAGSPEQVSELKDKIRKIEEATKEEKLLRQDDQNWSVRPFIPGCWITLSLGERIKEVERLNVAESFKAFNSEANVAEVVRIRKLPLFCYADADLLEAEVRLNDSRSNIIAYLFVREKTVFLNGKAAPIYQFNKDHGLQIENYFKAAMYLRFFCAAITGDSGTNFRIVESAADVDWMPNATPDDVKKFHQSISPLQLNQDRSGDWTARCTVVYQTTAYCVRMYLSQSGLVEMKRDLPITEPLPIYAEFGRGGLRYVDEFKDGASKADTPAS